MSHDEPLHFSPSLVPSCEHIWYKEELYKRLDKKFNEVLFMTIQNKYGRIRQDDLAIYGLDRSISKAAKHLSLYDDTRKLCQPRKLAASRFEDTWRAKGFQPCSHRGGSLIVLSICT